jgi:hypothetical protein
MAIPRRFYSNRSVDKVMWFFALRQTISLLHCDKDFVFQAAIRRQRINSLLDDVGNLSHK